MTNPDFDLPAFLLSKLYDNMDWDLSLIHISEPTRRS